MMPRVQAVPAANALHTMLTIRVMEGEAAAPGLSGAGTLEPPGLTGDPVALLLWGRLEKLGDEENTHAGTVG